MRIRQRAIVSTSFNVMFEALVPSIAFAWLGDAHEAIVVASAVVAAYATGNRSYYRGRQMVRADAGRSRSALLLFALGPAATVLFWANALVFASVAVYALALCVQLSVAVVSFYSLVSAATGRYAPIGAPDQYIGGGATRSNWCCSTGTEGSWSAWRSRGAWTA